MKYIYIILALALVISCNVQDNIFNDQSIISPGGFVAFEEAPQLSYDFGDLSNVSINTRLIDINNNVKSYNLSLTIDIDGAEDFKEDFLEVTSFPADVSITIQDILTAFGLTEGDITIDTKFKFKAKVITTDGVVYTGDPINFNLTTNQVEGGNTTFRRLTPDNAFSFIISFDPPNPVFYQLENESDDAEESLTGGNPGRMQINSSDLELGEYDTFQDQGVQIIGIRFNNIQVPQGAQVVSAKVQFSVDATGSNPVELTIFAENAANGATFDETIGSISSRALTTENKVWHVEPWLNVGERGASQRTSNFFKVVQEVVNRPDWVPGNSIVIIMKPTGETLNVTSSSGGREAEAGVGDDAAELILSYLE